MNLCMSSYIASYIVPCSMDKMDIRTLHGRQLVKIDCIAQVPMQGMIYHSSKVCECLCHHCHLMYMHACVHGASI